MTMNTLQRLQSEFRQYLLRPDARMQALVLGTERVDAATRLAIYADAYRQRLVEALDANYPVLHQWLGDETFNRLGLAYLERHPSRHYSIRWFGHRLPEFMAATSPWRDQAFVRELAAFEWAMSEAFDAGDDAIVAPEQVAALPSDSWPGMRLGFHASLRRLALRWNAPSLWHALTKGEPAEAAEEKDRPLAWIVWRQNLSLYYRSLDADEAWALDALCQKQNFAAICERLCEWVDAEHVAARAAGFLRQWVTDGLIARLDC